MSRCRFIQPEVVRLPLSDGDFLDVKQQLTAGEARDAFSRQIQSQKLGEAAELNRSQIGLSKVVAYVVGWSLVDADGKPVAFSESALKNVDMETFAEILAAVDAHEDKVDAEREARKNGLESASASSATSPSVSFTAGDTTTSTT